MKGLGVSNRKAYKAEMLDFLTKHFLVLSALLIGGASAVCMLFLAAYLAVFDWNLIWLIEYADLAKLFLIGTALLSSVITATLNYAYDFIAWLRLQMKEFKWGFFIGLGLIILMGGYAIYYDLKSENGHVTYHAFRLTATLSGIFLLYLMFTDVEKWKQLNWLSIPEFSSTLVFVLGIFGATYGYYVRDVSKNVTQITTKNETFEKAKVIMFLSHHLAFLSEKRVIVIPTSDLVQDPCSGSTVPLIRSASATGIGANES